MQWDERIGWRLKLRDLHYLLTVAQAGSMAKAAPLLSVSQPAISKAIADMEYMLGVPLLDRGPRGVEPTIFGRALLTSSHAIFDELRQGVREIEYLSDPSTGELWLGSNEASTLGIVATAIGLLGLQHPHIVIQVVRANTTVEQYRELRERKIEFSIGRMPSPLPEDEFEVEVLFEERYFVAAGAHNPWTRRRRVELAELLDEPWILPSPESVSGRLSADVFRASGLKVPRASVVTQSFELNHRLLEHGPFLLLMPSSILPAMEKYSSIRRVAVELPSQAGPVGIIKLRTRTLSPVARLFIAVVRSVAKAMIPAHGKV